MNANVHRQLNRRKRRILRRIENQPGVERPTPMMTASNIRYELTDRTRAIAPGGIGAIHLLVRKIGLIDDLDEKLHLLKRHLPYHESDHVLNIAYNLLAGGSRISHMPLLDLATELATQFVGAKFNDRVMGHSPDGAIESIEGDRNLSGFNEEFREFFLKLAGLPVHG